MRHHGVHHVSINVDDVDTNRAFYMEVLGFEPIDRPDLGIGGAWLQTGPQELHLVELPMPSGVGPHFALQVDDIEEASSELRGKGVDVSAIGDIPNVCRQAFFNDPAGNQIELNQRLG
ncbi:MAG: lactoylglutathione lyase [Acidimicrobiaceae bacterium]|nr:lactoylglutathione lyase [Acidimicrobiaceae bacterium]MYC42176.1 lactoylglutathione lyase [Acidimicrobiaceae bacterium]MYH87425.1 lactoylglutathione lyase [Acidimicrobiaceae bacterium]